MEAVGRKLLRAGKISDSEIETIAASPQLFESVRASIKAEKSRREMKIKNVFTLPTVQFWNWQKSALAFAVIGFLIVSASAIFIRFSEPQTARQSIIEEKQAAASSSTQQ